MLVGPFTHKQTPQNARYSYFFFLSTGKQTVSLAQSCTHRKGRLCCCILPTRGCRQCAPITPGLNSESLLDQRMKFWMLGGQNEPTRQQWAARKEKKKPQIFFPTVQSHVTSRNFLKMSEQIQVFSNQLPLSVFYFHTGHLFFMEICLNKGRKCLHPPCTIIFQVNLISEQCARLLV